MMAYFYIQVLTENGEYCEYDQTARSISKLSQLYLDGHRFLINGLEIKPGEVRKIRIFRTDKPSKEILGTRVWDIGVELM